MVADEPATASRTARGFEGRPDVLSRPDVGPVRVGRRVIPGRQRLCRERLSDKAAPLLARVHLGVEPLEVPARSQRFEELIRVGVLSKEPEQRYSSCREFARAALAVAVDDASRRLVDVPPPAGAT
jgi:hypothetical protein